jgi:Transposase IS116/IS110/IS902 family
VPDEAEEAVRDLLRCREAVRRDVLRWRHRLLKFLDRHGRLYVIGKNWSQRHWRWIRAQSFELPPLQRTFEATLFALEQALAHQAEREKEIEALAQRPPYAEPVGWLRCFRGIDTLSAMILVAEIADFQRFQRPRELMAYVGLVPSEYSSGEAERRGAITKTGNRACAAGTGRSRLALSPPPHSRRRPGGSESRTAAAIPGARLARPATAVPALSASRRPWQTAARRRDGGGPRTCRLPLGRHDSPSGGGGVNRPRRRAHADPEWRRARAEAGTIGESSS